MKWLSCLYVWCRRHSISTSFNLSEAKIGYKEGPYVVVVRLCVCVCLCEYLSSPHYFQAIHAPICIAEFHGGRLPDHLWWAYVRISFTGRCQLPLCLSADKKSSLVTLNFWTVRPWSCTCRFYVGLKGTGSLYSSRSSVQQGTRTRVSKSLQVLHISSSGLPTPPQRLAKRG